ncbi:MAG TPA: hypothetical protein ENN99_08580 [Chloroflexi bacterium]|nr:hypothetical protein [Chloroflexota bacterium]
MNRNQLLVIVVITALLTGGVLVQRGLDVTTEDTGSDDGGFRAWFWSYRTLDLAVQVGLLFAGALGVAAVLPHERDEEDDLCNWL